MKRLGGRFWARLGQSGLRFGGRVGLGEELYLFLNGAREVKNGLALWGVRGIECGRGGFLRGLVGSRKTR
jgi:hypothetical protein